MKDTRYWIGVASKDHVDIGKEGGFCQLCHGKNYPLKRMKKDDWIIYYSPKTVFGEKNACQQFTAIGRVINDEIYDFEMVPGFVPFRKDIDFVKAKNVEIRPLIERLEFINDKKRWGFKFRTGHFEISQKDFDLISSLMDAETMLNK